MTNNDEPNTGVFLASNPDGVPIGASEVNYLGAVGSRLAMDAALNCENNETLQQLIEDVLVEVGAQDFPIVVNGALIVLATGAVKPLLDELGPAADIARDKFRELGGQFRDLADELKDEDH